MSNLLKTELYKLFHSWYFWGIGIFNLLLSSILLLDSKERSSNLIMASLYNIPLLYFLSIVFIALFIGSDFSGRTLNTYITAGHKRSSIFRVKLIVSQIGCIIILVFPLFVHGIISQFYIGEKLFWNDSTYTMVLLTLFAMITLCALPMFFAFIFRDMGKTLTVSMVLFFVMIFLLNSESAQIISRIIPMGQLRLISLQKVYSTNFCLFVDFLWNFILYFIAGIYNLLRTNPDIIHFANPCHLILHLQFFRHALPFFHPLHQSVHHLITLLINLMQMLI